MTLKPILALLESADRQLTEAYKLCPDGSPEKKMVCAILVPLFESIVDMKSILAEIEREERRRHQG